MFRYSLVLAFILQGAAIYSQTVFFKSNHDIKEEQVGNLYSSIAIEGDELFFIASNYKMYGYNRTSGKQLWVADISYKSTQPVFVAGNDVFAPYYDGKNESTAIFNRTDGVLVKVLPMGPLLSNPLLRNGILYGTAIYDGGTVFAYDLKADSLSWWKFIAHGVSNQPYYKQDRIIANAEANNWFALSYDGRVLDTTCSKKADIFVRDLQCVDVYNALAHDETPITESWSEKVFGEEYVANGDNIMTSKNRTFILYDDQLVVLGNKRKVLKKLDLPGLVADSVRENYGKLAKILSCTDQAVSFLYNDYLIDYDLVKKKTGRMIDLSDWQPGRALLHENKLWLISRKDGQLYGLSF
jgi:hypothetical protein